LRNVKEGWTIDQRKAYFSWFEKARGWSGGASYQKFLTNIDKEAFENASEKERLAIEALGARKPYTPPPLPVAKGPGQQWTTETVLQAVGNALEKRDFKNGETMFAAARCVVCHRFGGDGGATGPDLTQSAGRFGLKDLVEAIVDPSKVVSDQYKATVVATSDGKSLTGRVVGETGDTITLLVDPENSSKIVTLKRSEIDEMAASSLSLMPKDLLITLNRDEVLDLLAYMLSRGDKNHAMFRK
jgi:putative heme-binding domain-containing protein